MSKPKFNRLRKLARIVKKTANVDFNMNDVCSCAGAVALGHPKLGAARVKSGVPTSFRYSSTDVKNLFDLEYSQVTKLFSCVGSSDLDKKKYRKREDGPSEGLIGKKVFARRVKKFFKANGKVL